MSISLFSERTAAHSLNSALAAGTLPPEWSDWSSLQVLALSGNNLTVMPSRLGMLMLAKLPKH